MSSILEALRELEGTKPPATRSRVAWAGAGEERPPLRRAAEVLGVAALGLALGGAGFALVVWLAGPTDEPPAPAAAPAVAAPSAAPPDPEPDAAPPPAAAVAPATPAPAWLARMGPPRGRVEGEREPGGERRAAAPAAGGSLELADLTYDERPSRRVARLRIGGTPVALREGESAAGVEVQLITPEGAYVRRGNEVLLLQR